MNIKNNMLFLALLSFSGNSYCESYLYKACKFWVLTCVTAGTYPIYKAYTYFKSKSDNEMILEAEKMHGVLIDYYKSKFSDLIKTDRINVGLKIKEDLEALSSYITELNKRASTKITDSLTLKKLNDTAAKLITLKQNIEFVKDIEFKK